jgi:hypothetical protein
MKFINYVYYNLYPHMRIFNMTIVTAGDRGSTVVKVLRYKSEGRWFDPRWCHEFFIDINSSDRTIYFLVVKAAGA